MSGTFPSILYHFKKYLHLKTKFAFFHFPVASWHICDTRKRWLSSHFAIIMIKVVYFCWEKKIWKISTLIFFRVVISLCCATIICKYFMFYCIHHLLSFSAWLSFFSEVSFSCLFFHLWSLNWVSN